MKQSIDYFPHYTTFSSKELDLRYDYGATGIGLYYAILNDIYGFEGYYVEITSTYIKRLTTENNITNENGQRDVKTTMKIMGQMLKSGLFDMTLYKKYKIFTSVEIQRNYFKVAERRVGSEIIEQYILPFSYEKLKNVNRNEENVNNVGKNDNELEQSREVKLLVNNNINTFSNECVCASVRVRERTEKERAMFKDYYKWWFYPHVPQERQQTVIEIIDTMIEALEQARTVQGIKFKEQTYYKSDMAKIISTIDPDRLGSIALSVETKKSYNKAWYILGCIINKGIKESAIRFQNDDFLHNIINAF